MLQSQAGGGIQKLLGGPVWVSDPARTDLKAPVTVEDGDIWYYRPDCDNPNLTVDSNLTFTPAYRGTICVESPWNVVYTAPTPGAFAAAGDVANTNPAPTVDANGCTVFSPGRYTVAPSFGTNTYLKSGNYYFHNVTLDITNAVVTAGWPDDTTYGDQQFIAELPVQTTADRNADKASGRLDAGRDLLHGRQLQDRDRQQGQPRDPAAPAGRRPGEHPGDEHARPPTTPPARSATTTTSCGPSRGNNSDLAIHGLLWAPRAQLEFGNVTNAANGQLLGGAALARIVLQASASASAFIIRVESSPIDFELKVDTHGHEGRPVDDDASGRAGRRQRQDRRQLAPRARHLTGGQVP